MNVLAIGCHPDDIECECMGTLIKCVKRGDRVTTCHVANGNMGHEIIKPDELRLMRREEARRAGALAGIEVVTMDVGDLLPNGCSVEQRDKIADLIREVKPDFIITHAPNDYMIDHVETSKLVFYASFSASIPHYRPDLGEATPVTPIFYMDNSCYIDFEPDIYVDISDVIDKKLEMLACHKSQVVWLMDHDGKDVLEEARQASKFRGGQACVGYAECFKICKADLRLTTKRLLP